MPSKTWMKSAGLPLALAASLSLAACGTTPPERAVSGGLLGAGTGAAIGAIAGNAGKGALFGGLAGALIGAVTSPGMIDLGPAPWHRTSYRYRRHHYARASCSTKAQRASAACKHERTAENR